MDIKERNQLVDAINLLRAMLETPGGIEAVMEAQAELGEDVVLEEQLKDEYTHQAVMQGVQERFEPSMNGKMVKKVESRIEEDDLAEPPVSEPILSDIAECVIELSQSELQRGKSMECVVIGSYTGIIAPAVSDSLSGAGGRILCIGDCITSDGISENWASQVGGNLGKTIYPVKGDVNENYQGLERLLDMVILSTCGTYQEMATMISRWAGLLRTGGVICGTQFDREHYQASVAAIEEVFDDSRIEKSDNGFWRVRVGA